MTNGGVPMVPGGLTVWADQSRLASRPAAMVIARAAMQVALRTSRAAPDPARRAFGIAVPGLDRLRRHPIRVMAGSMAAVSVLVVAVGWDAGPGAPLHSIQLAREEASLVLAGAHQAVDLRLDYAEARLRDAAAGRDRRDSLEEAAALLNAARPTLPIDHADALWQRWSHDESVLGALLAIAAPAAPATGPRHNDGGASPSSSGDQNSGGGRSGDDGSGGSIVGGTVPPKADDHGGAGSSSGKQGAPAASTAAADGSGRGGDSAGGSGSSTPDASPSASDDGGGG